MDGFQQRAVTSVTMIGKRATPKIRWVCQCCADYLLGNTELQQGRVTVVGYADSKPIATNDTREGRAKNRRIEVIVDGS